MQRSSSARCCHPSGEGRGRGEDALHAFAAFAIRILSVVLPRRPLVKGADDSTNFEDYSELEPVKHAFALSSSEQALFSGF